ncbi:MAG: hypothetical protein J6Y00_03640 [Paludibacteraceae bacterium]|nr:hypothetical protein [Paludibacteraceae bacterium]
MSIRRATRLREALRRCVRRWLEKEHVAVTPGLSFGDAFDGYIRLAFTLNDDVLRDGAARIRRFIGSLEG